MNKIDCDICLDLMPLVKDGIASDGSRQAVEEHLKTCPSCRALWDGGPPPSTNGEKAFLKFQRQIQIFSAMVMMFGIFFGLSLTAGGDIFYNTLIMPVIGGLGYFIFRWKALYNVPILLLLTHGVTNLFGLMRGVEHLDLYSLLMWTVLYSIFALIGVLIAGLLHFSLRKENQHE